MTSVIEYCVNTGVGEALNIDPRKFYTHFYALLLQLDTGEWLYRVYVCY